MYPSSFSRQAFCPRPRPVQVTAEFLPSCLVLLAAVTLTLVDRPVLRRSAQDVANALLDGDRQPQVLRPDEPPHKGKILRHYNSSTFRNQIYSHYIPSEHETIETALARLTWATKQAVNFLH